MSRLSQRTLLSRHPSHLQQTKAAKRAGSPLPDDGKVTVLIGPLRSAGLWRSR